MSDFKRTSEGLYKSAPRRAADERCLKILELIAAGFQPYEIDRRLRLRPGRALCVWYDIAEALGEDETAH